MSRVACVMPVHADQPRDIVRRAFDSANHADLIVPVFNPSTMSDWLEWLMDIEHGVAPCFSSTASIPGALNLGVHAARGEAVDYIAILSSDDIWLPGKVEHQVAAMEEHGWAASFTPYRMGGAIFPCTTPPVRVFSDNVMCPCTTMVRADVFDTCRFDEDLTYCQDWDFHCQVQKAFGWHRVGHVGTEVIGDGLGHTRNADRAERDRCRSKVKRRWRKGGEAWA